MVITLYHVSFEKGAPSVIIYGMLVIFSVIVLIFSAVIHEVMHGVVANHLGDPTARLMGRLTLNPLKHLDPFGSVILPLLLALVPGGIIFGWAKPVPYNPYNLRNKRWGEAIVAVAGSATNILLAIIFALVVRFGASFGFDATALSLAALIAFINLFLGFFNLIPFPPLDGFTALRAALPWHLSSGMGRFENRIRAMGTLSLILFLLIFSFIFVGPFFNFVSWIFGLLVGKGI